MVLVGVNYVSVIIATIASFVLGWLWFGPIFGNTWLRLNGKNPKKAKAPKKSVMFRSIILNFIGTIVMVYVLGVLIGITGMNTFAESVMLSFWIWLGFFASTTLLGSVLWDMKPWGLFVLTGAYWLLNLIVVGLILVSF